MVVGGCGVVGVGLIVAVAVGVPPVVTLVTVVTGVLLDVTVAEAAGEPLAGVTVAGACSSRKTTNGLVHQWSFVKPTCDGVGFAVGVALPPPKFKPEHDTRKKLDNSRQVDSTSNTCRQRATNDADCGTNIKKLLNNPRHVHSRAREMIYSAKR